MDENPFALNKRQNGGYDSIISSIITLHQSIARKGETGYVF